MATGQFVSTGADASSGGTERGGFSVKTGVLVATAIFLIVALIGIVISLPSSKKASEVTRDPSGLVIGSDTGLVGVAPANITQADADKAAKSEPFATQLATQVNQNRLGINYAWTLVAGFLVMFMQLGFALVETGFCRRKSALHVMAMNFSIYFLGMLGYFFVGFAFQFGGIGLGGVPNLGGLAGLNQEFTIHLGGVDWGLIGHKGFFLSDGTYDVGIAVLFLFNMVFMDTAATIPTGAMAERWKWSAFCVYGFFISTIIYPIFGNWAWGGGWLSQLGKKGLGAGYIDFAGSGVVHAVGGFTGLAGAYVLGARIGKYNKDGSSNVIPGHNMIFAIVGTLILAFGWFGFNPGSTLGASGNGALRIGMIATVTMLAGSAGAMMTMLLTWYLNGKPDAGMSCNGMLAGLVAITAPSGYVSPISAFIIGAVAGVIVVFSVAIIDKKLHIDDPVGAISVHGVCGIWGVLSVGLFADGTANYAGTQVKGLFFGDASQLGAQAIGALVIILWAGGVSLLFFKAVDRLMGLRSKPEDELAGLDMPEMGAPAYWDDGEPLQGGLFPFPAPAMGGAIGD
ncbi:MAG: ammonium transporter [Chloroflexota bacterium]|nr:ammonium transporter [Chloroflexota bacterium]